MSDANQIRINELARELEIKAKVLIDYLPEIGVTEKEDAFELDRSRAAEIVREAFCKDLRQGTAPRKREARRKGGRQPPQGTARPPAPPPAAPAAAPR